MKYSNLTFSSYSLCIIVKWTWGGFAALEDQIQRLTELRQELQALTTQTQSAEQQQKKLSSEISQAQRDNTCTKKGKFKGLAKQLYDKR